MIIYCAYCIYCVTRGRSLLLRGINFAEHVPKIQLKSTTVFFVLFKIQHEIQLNSKKSYLYYELIILLELDVHSLSSRKWNQF